MKRLNLVEQKFGRLKVKEFAYIKNGYAYWKCLCKCGNKTIVIGTSLKSGATKSCGCIHKEMLAERYKGKHLTKITRDKISKALKGRFKGKDSSNYGKKASAKTRKKISENHHDVSGENNPNYKPYLTDEERIVGRFYPGYSEWRKAVYERDNYTCQVCGDDTGGNLNAHHLESYDNNPDLRTSLDNGITLCEDCHKDFHHQYGYGNNTRKQYEEVNYVCER